MVRLFLVVDDDRSGKIDAQELTNLAGRLNRQLTLEEAQDIISEIDPSGDGQIDLGEFLLMMAQMSEGFDPFSHIDKGPKGERAALQLQNAFRGWISSKRNTAAKVIQAKFKSRFAERCVAARSIQAVARRRMTKRSVRAEILRRVDLVFGGQPEGQWRRTVVFSENAFLLKGCPMPRPMPQPRLLDEVMRDASFYGMRRYATELRQAQLAARCVQSAWRHGTTLARFMRIRVIRIQRHWKGIVHRANVNFFRTSSGCYGGRCARARADSIHRSTQPCCQSLRRFSFAASKFCPPFGRPVSPTFVAMPRHAFRVGIVAV